MSTNPNPPSNPDNNTEIGMIPQDSPARGAASHFTQPVTQRDLYEAQSLVDSVRYFNCVFPPNGVPNLEDVVYRPGGYNITNHVFRWDNVEPERAFRDGFRPRRRQNANDASYFSVFQYVHLGGRPLSTHRPVTYAFVSTTINTEWCPPVPRGQQRQVYRYEIFAPGGIHVAQSLRNHYRFRAQDEVAFIAGIAPQYIRSAQLFRIANDGNRSRPSRVNTTLFINGNFNPQAYTNEPLDLVTPVVDYLDRNNRRQLLQMSVILPSGSGSIQSRDASLETRNTDLIVPTPKDLLEYYKVGVADKDNYLDAAFRSIHNNEVYLFIKMEYVLVDYAPGSTNDRVLNGPLFIFNGFRSLGGTSFAEAGINAAFGIENTREAFIFSGALCARINYAPRSTNDWIIEGPMSIGDMFPFFNKSGYADGLDAAFEISQREAYVFRGRYCARITYVAGERSLSYVKSIIEEFPCFKDTIFASDIGAAFKSHRANEAYIFKGPKYALLNYSGATRIIGGVKDIRPNWPSLNNFVPSKNRSLDLYQHPDPPPDRPHDVHDEL